MLKVVHKISKEVCKKKNLFFGHPAVPKASCRNLSKKVLIWKLKLFQEREILQTAAAAAAAAVSAA
jgi:hypothetical protein